MEIGGTCIADENIMLRSVETRVVKGLLLVLWIAVGLRVISGYGTRSKLDLRATRDVAKEVIIINNVTSMVPISVPVLSAVGYSVHRPSWRRPLTPSQKNLDHDDFVHDDHCMDDDHCRLVVVAFT
jgi:hypothetical protein